MPHDANEYLKQIGEEGLREAIDQASTVVRISSASRSRPQPLSLDLGSDVEISERVASDLERRFGQILVCRQQVYIWAGTSWRALDPPSLKPLSDMMEPFTRPHEKVVVSSSHGTK